MKKQQARKEMKARLEILSEISRREADEAISAHVWSIPSIASASSLLIYAALPDEVATHRIAAEARRRGIELAYPRCLPEGRLALHRVESEGLLRSGQHGIMEPTVECPVITAKEIDAVLVPGLAWARTGHRLGRGAGYYDRLLGHPDFHAFRCGIFLADQEMTELPVDDWDVRLHAIVTENGPLEIRG